jgi:hypothetical protein
MISDKAAYLSLFLHDAHYDDEVTLPKLPTNSPSCRKPDRYGKSDAHDDHDDNDAHDDEVQRLSLRVVCSLKLAALGNHSFG